MTLCKNGVPVQIAEFEPQMQNARKVNIVSKGFGSEGVWVAFDEDGLRKYADDSCRDETIGVLLNQPFMPFPARWGAYIPVQFNGRDRPTCNGDELEGEFTYIPFDTEVK